MGGRGEEESGRGGTGAAVGSSPVLLMAVIKGKGLAIAHLPDWGTFLPVGKELRSFLTLAVTAMPGVCLWAYKAL